MTTNVGNNKSTTKKRGNPNPSYKFPKGVSGNPSGRPKVPEDVKMAFKAMTPLAIEKLQEIIKNPSTKESDRLRAIDIVLDRGLGKPSQEISVEATSIPQIVFKGADDVSD